MFVMFVMFLVFFFMTVAVTGNAIGPFQAAIGQTDKAVVQQ